MISSQHPTYLPQFSFNFNAVFFEVVRTFNAVLPMYFTLLRCFWMLHKLQNTHFLLQLQRNLIEKQQDQLFTFCKLETVYDMYPH